MVQQTIAAGLRALYKQTCCQLSPVLVHNQICSLFDSFYSFFLHRSRRYVRLRDLTSVTCYTRLKRELTRSGYALYTQVCACDNTTRHNKAKQKVERHLQSSGQSLLRKPNVKFIHGPWPLLYGPLLLRRKGLRRPYADVQKLKLIQQT